MAVFISLDSRLSAIAELAGKCGTLADIGCDHGRLCAYMLINGLCRSAVMTDISDASLSKAKGLIERLGLSDRAVFRVGDGAAAIQNQPDVAVIAGMGGTLVADIIKKGVQHLGDAALVLQPNVAVYELRVMLQKCGYIIAAERIVRDARRLYTIIRAERGEAVYSQKELLVGPLLMRNVPDTLKEYAVFRTRVIQKALLGAVRGGDALRQAQLSLELDVWKEYLP